MRRKRNSLVTPKLRKMFTAVALVVAFTVTLTGCVASDAPKTVSASGAANPNADVKTGPVACAEQGPWGDSVARTVITDEYGDYCAVTIDPNSNALTLEGVDLDVDSLTKYGYTEADAKAAQQVAVKTLVETSLDSTVLDNRSQTDEEWFTENKDTIVLAGSHAQFQEAITDRGLKGSGLVVTEGMPEPLIRDGGPRAQQMNISVDRIAADVKKDGVTPVMVVRTTFSVVYDVPNEKIVESILKNDASVTEDGLRASNPDLFEQNGPGIILQGVYVLGFDLGDNTKISAIANKWTLTGGTSSYLIASEG